MAYIFVSHATANDTLVTQLVEDLREYTTTDFWVDHLKLAPPESNWRNAIHSALQDSHAGLVIVSKAAVQRPEIVAEWSYLLNLKRELYVVKIDDVAAADIDYRLHIAQMVDLSVNWEAGLKALTAALAGEAAGPGAPISQLRPITGHIERKLLSIPIHGRDYGLWALRTRLKEAPTIILGIGGIGKSRIAAEMAIGSPDVDGAIWYNCTPTSRPDDILMLLCEHFGLLPNTPKRRILDELTRNRRMIILDDAEQVPVELQSDFVALFDELFGASAQVLVVSRSEWTAFDIIKTYRPQRPSKKYAISIVLDMQNAFGISHDLEPLASKIANAARCHPGLIEWAVKQMKRFPPQKVITDLRNLKSKNLVAALDEMVLKTMRRMVREEGSAIEHALRQLVIMQNGFTYDAYCALIDDDDDTRDRILEALVSWQFVRVIVAYGQTRYWVDPIVLDCVEGDPTAAQRHFIYYRNLAEQCHASGDYTLLVPELQNLEMARSYDPDFDKWLNNIWNKILTVKLEQSNG